MLRLRFPLKNNIVTHVFAASFVLLAVTSAQAMERNAGTSEPPVCAVVENFVGSVQILNADRTQVSDPSPRLAVGCGAWISVNQGGIRLRHRDGHLLMVGADSFVSLPQEGEAVLLYRGQVYGEAATGGHELQILTANARGRSRNGTVVMIYSEKEEESQLIALEKAATLENRFAQDKRMAVKGGEASSLNFKLLRVIPSAPRGVAVAALKSVLGSFGLENVAKRQNRRIASFPVILGDGGDGAADAETPEKKQARYMRHQPTETDRKLRGHWVGKFTGGTSFGHSLTTQANGKSTGKLEPSRKGRIPASSRIIVTPVSRGEDKERQKLIDELKLLEE